MSKNADFDESVAEPEPIKRFLRFAEGAVILVQEEVRSNGP